jgi:MoxR-like ATPase
MSHEQELSRARLSEAAARVRDVLEQLVPGQHAAIQQILTGYLASGHVLLEGVPGIGKTLLARCLAATLGLAYSRVQFTPDLMPADLIGANVFDPKSGEFRLIRGPVFTEVLLADEVNRTPPKTQAALLEAMQERQVTIDNTTHRLTPEFFVIATQNPVEFEGTYPLPEAQLDRFLLRVEMGLPSEADEQRIYSLAIEGKLAGWGPWEPPAPAVTAAEARALRRASLTTHVAKELVEYLTQLARAVRRSPQVELGVSPRAALSLMEGARAVALLNDRDFVLPDDLKALLAPAWAHRLVLTPEAEIEGHTAEALLADVARSVEVPR